MCHTWTVLATTYVSNPWLFNSGGSLILASAITVQGWPHQTNGGCLIRSCQYSGRNLQLYSHCLCFQDFGNTWNRFQWYFLSSHGRKVNNHPPPKKKRWCQHVVFPSLHISWSKAAVRAFVVFRSLFRAMERRSGIHQNLLKAHTEGVMEMAWKGLDLIFRDDIRVRIQRPKSLVFFCANDLSFLLKLKQVPFFGGRHTPKSNLGGS